MNAKRVPIRLQDPKIRITNFEEVCLGYSRDEAIAEANRCVQCKNPKCVSLCPVGINIPDFIGKLASGDEISAAKSLMQYTCLPAVCGRVCPQEDQCEKNCILGKKGEPVAIGKLERYIGDYILEQNLSFNEISQDNGYSVGIVGSGPAGIACANSLADMGYSVIIYEALHEAGGVLTYGIPEFRLPKEKIVVREIENLKKKNVKIITDTIIGRTISLNELKKRHDAVFIGSGAGLPSFLSISGENLNGVMSANEYLTRMNLMKAYKCGSHTPIAHASHVIVVGGGNVAMDAARCARRTGADVRVVYRREFEDLPAREEEIENAVAEGIKFSVLSQPTRFIGDDDAFVFATETVSIEVQREGSVTFFNHVENSEKILRSDLVILALGTNPNPLIPQNCAELKTSDRGHIITNDETQTSIDRVFAGGDAITGAATVILAMGAGKKAAESIHNMLQTKNEKDKNNENR